MVNLFYVVHCFVQCIIVANVSLFLFFMLAAYIDYRKQQRYLLLSAAWLNKMAVDLELKIIVLQVCSYNAILPWTIFVSFSLSERCYLFWIKYQYLYICVCVDLLV